MRVLLHNSPHPDELPPGQMSENGRSRRRRMPKSCDCCGAQSKEHVMKKRGRKKREAIDLPHLGRAGAAQVDSLEAPGTDLTNSSGMELVTSSELKLVAAMKEEQATPAGNDLVAMVNGTGVSCTSSLGDDIDSDAAVSIYNMEEESATETECRHQDTPITNHLEQDPAPHEPAEPGSSMPRDAMEIEQPMLDITPCADPLWDHHYCKSTPWHAGPALTTEEPATDAPPQAAEISNEGIVELIHEFLESFYEKYGSFIPLAEADVLDHLNKKLNADIKDMKLINSEVTKYKAGLAPVPTHHFNVTHNKHTLTLEDLTTLDDQNWVNDQVINMYGELIMEATNHKVHFFNSFFHRQLVAKGYEGVKRWTKKVDLFSKTLLLIPLHLEIHWSLITVDVTKQNINFYDSQGIMFKYAVENILRYILAEAKEKKQAGFHKGWKMIVNKCIPQQKNDSDCGVFVLEYCRCLAFKVPLLFTQEDMPRVRKRIYKELCECRLTSGPVEK